MQPRDRTLVNLETVFSTEPEPVDLTLTILGQAVEVEATPTTFHWVFGDGSSTTTTNPGRPYPARTITHRYQRAVPVAPFVEVTYTARFRLNAQQWQAVDGTVTTTGPPTTLRVAEAVGLLTG